MARACFDFDPGGFALFREGWGGVSFLHGSEGVGRDGGGLGVCLQLKWIFIKTAGSISAVSFSREIPRRNH